MLRTSGMFLVLLMKLNSGSSLIIAHSLGTTDSSCVNKREDTWRASGLLSVISGDVYLPKSLQESE